MNRETRRSRALQGDGSEVLLLLWFQIAGLRMDRTLWDGKLIHFRGAVYMENFEEARRRVNHATGFRMFSTLEEIEAMEAAAMNGDLVEVIVQCCAIHLSCVRERVTPDLMLSVERGVPWIFGSCRSLEEIAYLRSRLVSVSSDQTSNFMRSVRVSFIQAVATILKKPNHGCRWQGILLIFREARHCHIEPLLLSCLNRILEDRKNQLPIAAASLLLSYVIDAVAVNASFFIRMRDWEKRIILGLLESGASLMVSRENRHDLFRRLEDHIHTEGRQWWLEYDEALSLTSTDAVPLRRWPTALNILSHQASRADFFKDLAPYLCCGLDVSPTYRKRVYGKIPRLSCLAAFHLRESDLNALSPTLRFIATKHKPISMTEAEFYSALPHRAFTRARG